ncbi:MAG: hypothetical protein AAB877_03620, partial [Patescibacteria group bacterium]
IASLLELMSRLGQGEQFWLQFVFGSVDDNHEPEWREEADKIIAKITKRPVKKKTSFFDDLISVFRGLAIGPEKEGAGEKATYKWAETTAVSETGEREMVLTPGEREILTEIENKLKKPVFRTFIRGFYVAKREFFNSSHKVLTRPYFGHFQTQNMNYIRFSVATRPKTQFIFRKRIPYLRTRRMLRNYVMRFPPHFPDRRKDCNIFSTEELATIFHFPLKITGLVLPTMQRVESKKAGPPPNLPTE